MDQTAKRWEGPPIEAWRPWTPWEAAARLEGVKAPWCVVGGWALDLWLGAQRRRHYDLEIAIPRADLPGVREHLSGLQLHAVGDGEVVALSPGEDTPADKHQNWVADPQERAWRVDVMLEPGDAETWVFRRDETLTRPRARMVASTADGIPFLRPEGVLLFKAKAVRAKDEEDFQAALPWLEDEAREWLRAALERTHPDHVWRPALT
jgi:hypothetical protein